MTITQVGSAQTTSAINGATSSITFGTVPSQDDLVLVCCANGTASSTTLGPSTAGYNLISSNTGANPRHGAWYKFMTATPDTSVAIKGTAASTDSSVTIVTIWRGIDPTVFDTGVGTSTTATPQSVTSATAGDLWVQLYSNNANSVPTAAPTSPAGYVLQATQGATDSNSIGLGLATRIQAAAGAEAPNAWTGGTGSLKKTMSFGLKPAAGATAFNGTLTLSGDGALTTAGTPEVAGTLALSGSGTLTTAGTPAEVGVLGLSGTGTLTASGVQGFPGSASLSGSGTLAGTGVAGYAGSVALSGAGTLTTAGSPGGTGALGLSGSGTLTTSGTPAERGTVALSGAGTLTTTGTPAIPGTSALSGAGTLTTAGVPAEGGTLTLAGTGTLTASGSTSPAGSVSLTGDGLLVATGLPAVTGTLVLSGDGALSASGTAAAFDPRRSSYFLVST